MRDDGLLETSHCHQWVSRRGGRSPRRLHIPVDCWLRSTYHPAYAVRSTRARNVVPEQQAVTVTVQPRGVVVVVSPGQTVYEAAVEQGVRWPTTCQGMGTCRLCFMSVIEGADDLDPVEPFEAEGLAAVLDPVRKGPVRLACQVRPRTDLVVIKRGVRAAT